MKGALAITMALLAHSYGQTMPRADQLVNVQQIRICNAGDTRPGTLVGSCQIADGRRVATVDGLRTVCVDHFFGVAVETGPMHVIRTTLCYSETGLALLVSDPAWLAWWSSQP